MYGNYDRFSVPVSIGHAHHSASSASNCVCLADSPPTLGLNADLPRPAVCLL